MDKLSAAAPAVSGNSNVGAGQLPGSWGLADG